MRELKISRDTITAIRGLIMAMETESATIEKVKMVLDNDESLIREM
jgi:hypothetical protein